MEKYKIIAGNTYDIFLWDRQKAEWVLVRSCASRCEALEYINRMLSAILKLRESELREARQKSR